MRALAKISLVTLALFSVSCATTSAGAAEDSYVQTEDGTLLAYRKLGSGDEVLIVPGDNWIGRDIERLAKDRTVVFYDARGRGRSEARMTTSLETDLADLEAVREWFGFERISLLGMDYQAALVALYAATYPERVDKLVVLSPIPVRKFPHWKIYYQIFNENRDPETLKVLNEMQREGVPKKDPEAWAREYQLMIVQAWVKDQRSVSSMKSNPYAGPNANPELLVVRYFDMLRNLGDWDWRPKLGAVEAQSLVVYGDSDPMPAAASREWVTSMPNSSEAVIEGSGRMPWIEKPRSFFGAIDDFLDR